MSTPLPEPRKTGLKEKWSALSRGKKIGVVLAVLFVIGLIGSILSPADPEETTTASQGATTTVVETVSAEPTAEEAAPDPTTAEEAAEEDPAEENPAEEVPVEYRNALRSAEMYLSTMPFSKRGLYDQLTSEYGEGFEPDAAQYAVDNVEVDWNEQALKSARTYQDTMAMSKSAIYDQLVSEAGEQYTPEQAQYAVDNLPD